MKLPYTLTLEDVTRACRKTYEKKRLTAQRGSWCVYKDGKYRCAIGAAMPLALLNKLEREWRENEPISSLHKRQIVDCGKDLRRLQTLQTTHDKWVLGDLDEKAFLAALRRCEREVARRS